MPPSFVADPPIKIFILEFPLSKLLRISWPVPRVLVFRGFRSDSLNKANPDALAISM